MQSAVSTYLASWPNSTIRMQQTLRKPKQVCVVGSGIGGLSTAIILAGLGYGVTVLEKNRLPGGLMRGYRRGGVECSVGIHYLGSLDKGQILRRFFDFLGVSATVPVERMGEGGIIDRYLFRGPLHHPKSFDLPSGLDAFEGRLEQTFPDERGCIGEILAPIRRAARQLHGLDFLYGENDFSLLDQSEPLGKILDGHKCSPGLRSILSIPSCWIGVPLEQCPAYYHNMALASYASSSYRLGCSGSEMADALATRLKELGGTIITRAEVEAIEVDSRVVKGVRLAEGRILPADTVVGAVHPKVMLTMLPDGAVKPSYRQRISGLRDTHSIFSACALLDAGRHPEIPHNIFLIDTDAKGNVLDLRYYQIRETEREGISLLSILSSGREELWAPWSQTRTGRRGSAYDQLKEKHAQGLLQEAEELLGPFHGLQLLDTYSPLSIRDWVNSPNGSAYGVLRSNDQTLATALLNRTGVQGLYLAGQSVMAPGIIGTIMGSFATVKLIVGVEMFRRQIQL
jgi:all-trans-retinol 13,14-reductase